MEFLSPLFFLLMFIVGAAGLVLPLRWMLRVWLEDQLVKPPVAIAGLFAHLVLLSGLSSLYPILGIVYCGVILLVIALCPLLSSNADRRKNNDANDADIEYYQRLIERRPENAAAHAALADIYRKTKRYEEAIAEYEQAITLDPSHSREEAWKLEKVRREKLLLDQKSTKNDGKLKNEPTS